MVNYRKPINGLCFVEDIFDRNGDKKFCVLFDNDCNLIPLANDYLKYFRETQTNSFCTINRIARDLNSFYDFLCISKFTISEIDKDKLKQFVKYLKILKVRAIDKNDEEFIRKRYAIERTLWEKLQIIEPNKRKISKVVNLKENCGLDTKSIYRIFERLILYLRYLYKKGNYNKIELLKEFETENDIINFLKAQKIEASKHHVNPVDDTMVFREEEILEINKSATTPYERLLYFILEKTGIRIGEALGLKIFNYQRESLREMTGDISYKDGSWDIYIRWRPDNPFFCRTKSHRERKITLKKSEIAKFELLLERYLRWRFKKVRSKKNEWLFISNRSNHLTQNVAYSQFIRTLNKAFLEHRRNELTLHSYRHTFSSRELQKGVPIEAISKILGHKHIKTTHDIYIHYTSDDIVKIRENIDKKLEDDFNARG